MVRLRRESSNGLLGDFGCVSDGQDAADLDAIFDDLERIADVMQDHVHELPKLRGPRL